MSRYPRERVELSCSVCDGKFEVVKSRLGKAKFCSNKCRGKASMINDVVHNCDNCGEGIKELATHRDQINRHGSKRFFCSRECYLSIKLVDMPIGTIRKCKATGFIFIKTKNNVWEREHRIVADEAIGSVSTSKRLPKGAGGGRASPGSGPCVPRRRTS